MNKTWLILAALLALPPHLHTNAPGDTNRPRARELGVETGVFKPGAFNAITDVPGVRVGQVTIIEDEKIRTGVTAIVPP
jgi:D-aminopeptidase